MSEEKPDEKTTSERYYGPFDFESIDAALHNRGKGATMSITFPLNKYIIDLFNAYERFYDYITMEPMTLDDFNSELYLLITKHKNMELFIDMFNKLIFENHKNPLNCCKILVTRCYDILDNLMYYGGDANPIVAERIINDAIKVLEGKYNTLFWEANQHLLPIESHPPYRIGPLP